MKTTLVLGAGVVGMTTAYFLAETGRKVTVVERLSEPAMETSFANAGEIAPGHSYTWGSPAAPKILMKSLFHEGQALRLKFKACADPRLWAWGRLFLKNCSVARSRLNTSRKLVLCRYSQAQLRDITQRENLHYELLSNGLMYLYRTEASFQMGTAKMKVLVDGGLPLEVLNTNRVIELEPTLAQARNHIAGAIYCPTDETGDARIFTLELAKRCRERGVKFEFNRTVQSIDYQSNAVIGIQTDKGPLHADEYVVALGCHAPFLVRPLGYKLPIYPVKGYSVTFPTGDTYEPPDIGGVDENNLVAYARFGNRLRFTATAEFNGFDKRYSAGDFRYMLNVGRELFPNGADYSKPDYWVGLRPMTPDNLPIIGKTNHRNLFLNTGHGHMGWTMSCGSARVLTDIMCGRTPEIDMTGMALI